MDSGLAGKRVLVTGASGGIGSACARAFADEISGHVTGQVVLVAGAWRAASSTLHDARTTTWRAT
jgi:NAD(P)-dependent dehydrogenase (short-subunit alcohol dehydrogenase family)